MGGRTDARTDRQRQTDRQAQRQTQTNTQKQRQSKAVMGRTAVAQYFCFVGHESTPSTLKCGVPQGWVLGHLLFALYTQPLCTVVYRSGH